jgi:hypothetical protein
VFDYPVIISIEKRIFVYFASVLVCDESFSYRYILGISTTIQTIIEKTQKEKKNSERKKEFRKKEKRKKERNKNKIKCFKVID